MASDYSTIRDANKTEYGNVGRWGRDVLVNRYDSTAHFVFELLQNAEDALKRRIGWSGSREVHFDLSPTSLRILHCGNPFTLEDVKGVCGVGETTKDLTDIGRFGIGFKSVYAVTDRPEVHSGEEDFAIDNFVYPTQAAPTSRGADQTAIVLPLRTEDAGLLPMIADSLSKLGARTLLFLRQIDEIGWSVSGSASGLYLKERADDSGTGRRRVTLIGERKGGPIVEESWLVFSREAKADSGALAGFIEIAFLLQQDEESKEWAIQRLDTSPLCAFFPTVVATHLGFLLQGPYRTTPSRDNVPPRDPWNVRLIRETAALLLDSMRALRAENLLNVAALQCLPIERAKYPEGSMFAPLFDAVRTALASESLLPRALGGWTTAKNARLARTQELRELFDSKQLTALLGAPEEVHWLSGDITRDTASTLHNYLLHELNIPEVTPESILPRLTKPFLEAQPDEWILKLYEFLSGQPSLVRQGRVSQIPLVRIEDGNHVVAERDGQHLAFLASEIRTDFPTVRRTVCSTEKALGFLKSLGLTEPDAVDDVVRNVIPKYRQGTVEAGGEEYGADLNRIFNAFSTQHSGQREKLIAVLKEVSFVMSVDAGSGSRRMSKPGQLYLPTERLREIFAGVAGVLLVDDSCSNLKGEAIRGLLEACGAARCLRPVPNSSLSHDQRATLRVKAGHAETSGQNDHVTDWTLLGLNGLLAKLPALDAQERCAKARLIWEELGHLEERRGKAIFTGEYTWTHYGSYRATFDAAFVRSLNEIEWVPDQNGEAQRPESILFDSLRWHANPFLLSKILFKPPILDLLAKEAGIEPGALDLLKKLGVTSEAALRARLGVKKDTVTGAAQPEASVKDALESLLGDAPEPTPPEREPGGQDPAAARGGTRGDGKMSRAEPEVEGGAGNDGHRNEDSKGRNSPVAKRTPGGTGGQPFISYVGAHPEDEEPDPDGLDHAARMALEDLAIELILRREPEWWRTPTHNPGFDLYQGNDLDSVTQWCEVKAMAGRLADRPVGLSRTQFECARANGGNYWLYVVECAGTDAARLVRIQNPAGKARTFTFDHGWLGIAQTDSEEEPRED